MKYIQFFLLLEPLSSHSLSQNSTYELEEAADWTEEGGISGELQDSRKTVESGQNRVCISHTGRSCTGNIQEGIYW